MLVLADRCRFHLLDEKRLRNNFRLDPGRIQAISVDQFSCSAFDALFVLWEESASVDNAPIFWNISSAFSKV